MSTISSTALRSSTFTPAQRRRRSAAIAVAVLCSAAYAVQAAHADAAAEHPVAAHFMAGIAAFNAGDVDVLMEQWDEDIQMYAADTGWLRGKAAVRARFVTTFQRFPNVRMVIEDLRVRSVAEGVATVDFRWAVHPRGAGPAFHGTGSGVYILRGDRWVEVLEHESLTSIDEELRRGAPAGALPASPAAQP